MITMKTKPLNITDSERLLLIDLLVDGRKATVLDYPVNRAGKRVIDHLLKKLKYEEPKNDTAKKS